MYSAISPGFLYTDVSSDITEHDINVISDLWTFDNREVYRGSRDTAYTHANVYWLYNEDLDRVGCVEHNTLDHSEFETLWFYDNPFATLFQEEGWVTTDSLWAILPQRSVELFLAEGLTKPELVLEHCLHGPTRVLSPVMLMEMPDVFECEKCNKRSITRFDHGVSRPMDFPEKGKILFVDDDMIVSVPPIQSRVWSLLGFTQPQPLDDDSSLPEQEPVLEPTHKEPTPPQSPQLPPLQHPPSPSSSEQESS